MVINPGDLRHKIVICSPIITEDTEGFRKESLVPICETYAAVKTTKGFTLIVSNTDFEDATVNFTIRLSVLIQQKITRDCIILCRDKKYSIEYLNNIDYADTYLEIQAKEITK